MTPPRFKVISVAVGTEAPRQFVIHVDEKLSIGRAPNCDIVTELRGASNRHAELTLQAPDDSTDGAGEVRLTDVSTNGSGTNSSCGTSWIALRKGEGRTLSAVAQVLLPYNRKCREISVILTIRIIGDSLPDAWDQRNGVGRWRYIAKLGEGALGIVYRAQDMTQVFPDEVAVKVCKMHWTTKRGARLRHAYILHREAQWSLQRLHNKTNSSFCAERAAFFVRYLEDHSGRWAPELDFEAERTVFEAPDFVWDSFGQLQTSDKGCPYVVMELVPGRTLHHCMGWTSEPAENPPLTTHEKVLIARQLARALEYLASFHLIHRDFRTTNLLLVGRGELCKINVIDLGHTVAAEPEQVKNRSAVVRCSWMETKVKQFDWAPDEVKDKKGAPNFSMPTHAFDVFSLAMLFLQLELSSLRKAREVATSLVKGMVPGTAPPQVSALGVGAAFLRRMLGPPSARPPPSEVLRVLYFGPEAPQPARKPAVPLPLNDGGGPAQGGVSPSVPTTTQSCTSPPCAGALDVAMAQAPAAASGCRPTLANGAAMKVAAKRNWGNRSGSLSSVDTPSSADIVPAVPGLRARVATQRAGGAGRARSRSRRAGRAPNGHAQSNHHSRGTRDSGRHRGSGGRQGAVRARRVSGGRERSTRHHTRMRKRSGARSGHTGKFGRGGGDCSSSSDSVIGDPARRRRRARSDASSIGSEIRRIIGGGRPMEVWSPDAVAFGSDDGESSSSSVEDTAPVVLLRPTAGKKKRPSPRPPPRRR